METEQNAEKAHRLLTTARVHQMRGNLEEAFAACREAVVLDPDNAAALEMLGDLQAARGEPEAAIDSYRASFQRDARPAVEEKIALMALRIQEKKLGDLGGPDSSSATGARKRVNPSLACALSMLFPGLGQLYNGEYKKGFAFIAVWALLAPNLYLMVMAFVGPLFGHKGGYTPAIAWFLGFIQMGVYIAALMDASLGAVAINRGKSSPEKSGWEV